MDNLSYKRLILSFFHDLNNDDDDDDDRLILVVNIKPVAMRIRIVRPTNIADK